MIDEGLLAGEVVLPQHHIQMVRPIAIQVAEPTVVDPVRLPFLVFLLQQLQRDTAVGLQLVVSFGEVWQRPFPCGRWGWRNHAVAVFTMHSPQDRKARPEQTGPPIVNRGGFRNIGTMCPAPPALEKRDWLAGSC